MSIKTEIKNQIATVTLSRAEVHNALNEEMIQGLTKTFLDLGQDNQVRAIILAADGKTFCAGADLNWMSSMLNYTLDENIADAKRLAKMLQTIYECPKPVICRVQGAAFGGGVGLVSACDMVVAIESATFSLSEVKIGLIPAVISPFVLQKMPVSFANRYFLTAERFSSSEALRMGFISSVVSEPDQLDKVIEDWTKAILQNAPEAIDLCKSHIRDVLSSSFDEGLEHASRAIAERRISKEGQEGMKAFFEKRKPYWVVDGMDKQKC